MPRVGFRLRAIMQQFEAGATGFRAAARGALQAFAIAIHKSSGSGFSPVIKRAERPQVTYSQAHCSAMRSRF